MERLTLADLGRGDIAIIECQIHRFHTPRPEKGAPTPWTSWRANLKLCAITRLWEATSVAREEQESDADQVDQESTDDEGFTEF